jgi:DNA-binding CsgD family transcriptional regulator
MMVPSANVIAYGKSSAQFGSLFGMLIGIWLTSNFESYQIILPVSLFVCFALVLLSLNCLIDEKRSKVTVKFEQDWIDRISDDYRLSPRESEVLMLLAKGRSISAIAAKLYIAKSTAATHSRSIYRKLNIHNRQELIDFVEKEQ